MITVIVLLILAGTAISIALNENNIFEKANTAVSAANAKTEEQGTNITQVDTTFNTWFDQYNQSSGGSANDTTAPSAPTGITVTNVTGTKATVQATGGNDDSGTWSYKYSIDNGTTWTEAIASTQSYTYTNLITETQYTVIAKSVDGAGNESSPIATGQSFTTTAVYDGNIGRYVHYAVNLGIGTDTSSVDDDWVVFYEDKEAGYTYIIAADYVPNTNSALTAARTALGFSSSGTYNVYSSSSNTSLKTTILASTATRNKLSWFDANRIIEKVKHEATASLLDTTVWSEFALTSINSNIQAVGGPTADLWVASWNQRGYTTLNLNINSDADAGANGNGYYIGIAETPTTTSQSVAYNATTFPKTGYSSSDSTVNNPVYFPRTAVVDNCYGYWLASPSANTGYNDVMYVYYGGNVSSSIFRYTNYCVRPVVSMPTSIIENSNTPDIYFVD